MAHETASTRSRRVDYSNVDIYFEEAPRIDSHRPAMVTYVDVSFEKRQHVTSRFRIMPSKLWTDDVEVMAGLLTHESIHKWLLFNFSNAKCVQLDNLPKPENFEVYMTGVWGWNLNNIEWKWRENRSN